MIRKTKLRYPELSEADIANRVGCSPSNVHHVLVRFLGGHSEEELRQFQKHKADVMDSIQMRSLESITNADIAKAPFGSRVVAAAILEDKGRLIRGQPTAQVELLIGLARDLRRDLRGQVIDVEPTETEPETEPTG